MDPSEPDPFDSEDDLDPIDEAPKLNVAFFFGSQAAGAVLLVLLGVLGAVAASAGMGMPRFVSTLAEMGMALPLVTELVISAHLNLVCVVVGVLSAVLVVGMAFLRKPLVSWVVFFFLLMVTAFPSGVCLLSGFVMSSAIVKILGTNQSRPPPDPGETAELADEVLRELRAALERGVGEVRSPKGERWRYVVLAGPGLPAAPAQLPEYAKARELAGCVLLPQGPAGNTRNGLEIMLHMPAGAKAPAVRALDDVAGSSAPPWVQGFLPDATDMNGTPTDVVPAIWDVDGDYSYGLSLRRARLDTSDDGVGAFAGGDLSEELRLGIRLNANDVFSDELIEVRLSIYRSFDPTLNPTGQGGWTGVVPLENIPVRTFRVLLRVPR